MNLLTAMKVAKIMNKGGLNTAFSLLDRITKEDIESLCVGVYGKSKKFSRFERFKENTEKLIEDYLYELNNFNNLNLKYMPKKTPEQIAKAKESNKPLLNDCEILNNLIHKMVRIGYDPKDYDLEDAFYLLRENEKEIVLSNFQSLLNRNLKEEDKKVIRMYLKNWDYNDLNENKRRLQYYIYKG